VNRDPVTDARQLFDGYPAPGAFGKGNDLLGDTVVFVALEAGFLSSPLPQEALRRLRAFGLETTTELAVPFAKTAKVACRVERTVTVGSHVSHAHIDTEKAFRIASRGCLALHGEDERKRLFSGE
jgi:hypothetical protein